jgi:Bacteriophytochrome (light-regulated signal transduction histidine kinase)
LLLQALVAFFILECIAGIEHSNTVYDVLQHTNELVQVVNTRISLQELCQLITKKIHDITGYDRVMVYRFDENYNGDIFAETVVPEHEPFLGLHYPHTDIPAQARALYIRNLMRLIVDVNYEPVPVVTMNQELAQPEKIDMSDLHLRSVSPIHIQYLKNMGVKGTFTISLIKEGRLWGMIACHHYSPKNLSYARQIQAFLQTQILSSQLGVQETAEMYELAASLEPSMRALQEKLSQDGNFIKNYFEKCPR